MLFNSYEFIFVFLPIVLLGFFFFGKLSPIVAARWLGLASLFFYGWWSIKALPLLIISITINYWFGIKLSERANSTNYRDKLFMAGSIAANLAVLGYFKYANFFVDTLNVSLIKIGSHPLDLPNIILPIGISFYTFTQIAFLVDCWQGKVKERNFSHYLLFVTYFPHLIAGPVLHHSQMMPQFKEPSIFKPDYLKCIIGVIIFTIGLAKKILLADPLSIYAAELFDLNLTGGDTAPTFIEAWFGVLSYALQIYFDFSGYSDMAIGMSLLFNIDLPINFHSPYRATSIIDFWRRWHISLSNFLRDYLYIPLGGSKCSKIRRYFNLLITMLLGGLWHGANWTYVLWGGLHGLLLIINHGWRWLFGGIRFGLPGIIMGWMITFIAVCFTWVAFKASSMKAAITIYKSMVGMSATPEKNLADVVNVFLHDNTFSSILAGLDVTWSNKIFLTMGWFYTWFLKVVRLNELNGLDLLVLGGMITLLPFNSNSIATLLRTEPEGDVGKLYKTIFLGCILGVGLILLAKCLFAFNKHTVFIYYQF